MMNVLIATPTYNGLLRQETADSVHALEFSGDKVWAVVDENPYPYPDMRNVLAGYQAIRKMFLEGDYDAMLAVEHDMVLPWHALQALWDLDKPVAYGVYLLRHGSLVLNVTEHLPGSRNMGESLSIRRKVDVNTFQGVMQVSGVGFGCTLIRRPVLEELVFHDGGDHCSPDVPFAYDCLRHGFEQWADFSVLCGHIEAGCVLMPGVDDVQALRKVVAEQDMNVLIEGEPVRIWAGKVYEMPAGAVSELQRAGFVRAFDAEGTRNGR